MAPSEARGHRAVDLGLLLAQRGLSNGIRKGRYDTFITRSAHMHLVGLGFNTATRGGRPDRNRWFEAIAGGLPRAATIALPILFAAGICLMDTLDGVFMSKAYRWLS